jgi:hypothetical protein
MKIEVMVDKDNTHFSYKFDCDKVIDGTSSGMAERSPKLVIMRFDKKAKGEESRAYETIAVFNIWTFWRIIPDE